MENGEELVGPPQLSLQWHQHHNTLVSLLDALWERQELVDVTLAADGQCIQVHRIVLCACSKYFQDVLTLKGNSSNCIVFLKDVSYDDLKALVDYMYKGEVRINEDQLNSFLHTAKSLGIRGLMGDGKKGEAENGTKRKRRMSVEISSDQEEVNSLATSTPPPPPPPPMLKHKTSLTKPQQNVEVKCELPLDQDGRFESTINNMQPETESLTQNSSIHSGQELEDDELDLFQHCGVNTGTNHHHHHPGPSRLSAEELHTSGQDHYGNWILPSEIVSGRPQAQQQRIPCPNCHRTYSTIELLKRHLKFECGVEPQFECPICHRRTRHKHNLTAHLKTHFRGDRSAASIPQQPGVGGGQDDSWADPE